MPLPLQSIFDKYVSNTIEEQIKSLSIGAIPRNQGESDYLFIRGEKLCLNTWVTISTYKTLHNLESTNVVSNWIKRGKIPPENIRKFPEIGLTLIKNESYT